MGQRSFDANLKLGRLGEELVCGWFRSRGWGTIPSYEYTGKNGTKAPRLMFRNHGLVLPDMDLARSGQRVWAELKTYKETASNRVHGIQVHGFERRLYEDYLSVELETGCKVVLFVLQYGDGKLLVAGLSALTVYPCLCKGCRAGSGFCSARIKRGVYFDQEEFRVIHRFEPSELVEIREAA